MATVDDVDELIERYYRAQREFLRGNPETVKDLFSQREDVTLANLYGPPVRGFDEVAKTIEHAASLRRDGTFLGWQIGSSPDFSVISSESYPSPTAP